MKILITDGGDIINQDHIKKIEVEAMEGGLHISYYLSIDSYSWDIFYTDEDINSTFAEELFREILINECKKDVIDMRKVNDKYKNRERLKLDKEIEHEEI